MQVDVVIPAHNAARTVHEAVGSVLAQTQRAGAVVVVADACSDDTAQRARDAGAVVHEICASSAATARNAGVRLCNAPWVAFLDADDVWAPSWLSTVAGHQKHNDAAVYYGGAFEVLADGRHYPRRSSTAQGDVFETLLLHCFVVTSATVVRRDALISVGGFDETFSGAGVEDYDLWLRLASRHAFTRVPGHHVYYHNALGSALHDPSRNAALRDATLQVLHRAAQLRPIAPHLYRRARANAYRMAAERTLAQSTASAVRDARAALLLDPTSPSLWLMAALAALPSGARRRLLALRRRWRTLAAHALP